MKSVDFFLDFFERIPFKKTISIFLIFAILVSQTIRWDFFLDASADIKDYRDIVSLIVDQETYKELRPEISRYAEDIQKYLGGTRTSIVVIDPNTTPAQIAAKNEALYFQGDGDNVDSHLVGTVLIGNIPIPMVSRAGEYFPSIFPYVDFTDKAFVYNPNTHQYEQTENAPSKYEAAEIWHGVMNPALGRTWDSVGDIEKIRVFLNKSHDFYQGKGVFAQSTLAPKVFYYDGFYESQSVDARSLFQYGLYLANIENFVYNRFTKYLLRDVNNALIQFDKKNDQEVNETLKEYGIDVGNTGVTEDMIADLPDIQTIPVIKTLVKSFSDIVNEKVLGEALADVRNAGRYNDEASVRADLPSVTMTLTDDIAAQTIKAANTAFEKAVDDYIRESKSERKIAIYDSSNVGYGHFPQRTYENYYFGGKAISITDPSMCTIVRGSTGSVMGFGRSQSVEANVAFDVLSSESQIEKLKADTEIFAPYGTTCFPQDAPIRTQSYWGGNSLLRIAAGSASPSGTDTMGSLLAFPAPATFRGFLDPIFSLGGMRESDRIPTGTFALPGVRSTSEKLPQLFLNACTGNQLQYAIKDPYNYEMSDWIGGWNGYYNTYTRSYPDEWNRNGQRTITNSPRYTCLSSPRIIGVSDVPSDLSIATPDNWSSYYDNGGGTSIPIVGQNDTLQGGFFEEVKRYRPSWTSPGNAFLGITPKTYYATGQCLKGSLFLNGTKLFSLDRPCTYRDDERDIDNTTYRDIYYHTIDSMIHHTSPTTEEVAAAQENGATPNLPVDIVRSVEFMSPNGIALMLRYPNFFSIPVDKTLDEIKAFVKNDLDNQWSWMSYQNSILISEEDAGIAHDYLHAGVMQGISALPIEIKTGESFQNGDISEFAAYACDSTGKNIKDIFGNSVCGNADPVEPLDSTICNGQYDQNNPDCRTVSSSENLTVEKYAQSQKPINGSWFSGHVPFSGSLLFHQPVFEKNEQWRYLLRYQNRSTDELDNVMLKITLPANVVLSGSVDATTGGALSGEETFKRANEKEWDINIGDKVFHDGKNHTYIVMKKKQPITQLDRFPDWSEMVSEDTLLQVIQARNWLNPDVTTKHRKLVESMLSYSHGTSGDTSIVDQVPRTDSGETQDYEIAYLGLSSFLPLGQSTSDGSDAVKDAYTEKLNTLRALNISEEDTKTRQNQNTDNGRGSASCGPIDGVDIFQWPSAIQCWIKTQLPPKIYAGMCGPNILGSSSDNLPTQQILTNNPSEQKALVSGSSVVPKLDRLYYTHGQNIAIEADLRTATGHILPPMGTRATLLIDSVISEGKTIAPAGYPEYFSLGTTDLEVSGNNPNFLITAKQKDVTISAKIRYTLKYSDGTTEERDSQPFTITVGSSYLDGSLFRGDSAIGTIDSTAGGDVSLQVKRYANEESLDGTLEPSFTVRIINDVTEEEVLPNTSGTDGHFSLPNTITSFPGTYRAYIVSSEGIAGEMTFTVKSGATSNVKITPASSALIRGSSTVVTVALTDKNGNEASPDLSHIVLTTEGGKMIDGGGNPVDSLTLDTLESSISFVLDASGGSSSQIVVHARVNDTLDASTTLKVVESATVSLQQEKAPRIGEGPVRMKIKVSDAADPNKLPIGGFSSVVSWSLPSGGGNFDTLLIPLTNGVSPEFTYSPGTKAGKQGLNLSIPGVGNISDIALEVLPGKPLYIDHGIEGNSLIFRVKDRYGNVATDFSGSATISRNNASAQLLNFSGGEIRIPKQSGGYSVNVPALANSSITYTDEAGEHVIMGMPQYITTIFGDDTKFQFQKDYNARYTVLAGGSFLREGEDILYNITPGKSQSLAVSTLLDTPFVSNTVFTIFPGGGYKISNLSDTMIEGKLSFEKNFPIVSLTDQVENREIARVLYRMDHAGFELCKDGGNCNLSPTKATIQSILIGNQEDISQETDGSTLNWKSGNTPILTMKNDGSIQSVASLTFELDQENTAAGLGIQVFLQGTKIGTIRYFFDKMNSVDLASGDDIFASSSLQAPVLQSLHGNITPVSSTALGGAASGYGISLDTGDQVLDTIKSGPSDQESIGSISENPGVGWKGGNRMMLSYSAGDIAGEATKWFQTYTFVNLGDPVAHVDQGRVGTQTDGIDRTVGTQIADSRNGEIKDFFHKDMNNDGYDDILVRYLDGRIDLLLNLAGKYRSRGNIAFLPDLTQNPLQFADFQGDGYADIISTNASGSLVLLSNNDRKFSREVVTVDNGDVPVHISQMKIRDMDNDGKDDLVYLTAGGELGILYGSAQSGKFEKKILDATLGLTLEGTPVSEGGAFYGSNVPQMTDLGVSDLTGTGVTDDLINTEVYTQEIIPTPKEDVQETLSPNAVVNFSGTLSDLENQYSAAADAMGNNSASVNGNTNQDTYRTYIKSEYAPGVFTDIKKSYKETGGKSGSLKPYDMIDAIITIKNTSADTPITNAMYLDTVPDIFSLDAATTYQVVRSGKGGEEKVIEIPTSGDYDAKFFIGNIAPGEEVQIRYSLKVLPVSYGEMFVGDFESGTDGADMYGDVSFKTENTCGAEEMLWVSTGSRAYQTGIKNAVGFELPDSIASQVVDSDGNGIPDSVENPDPAEEKKISQSFQQSKTNDDLISTKKVGDKYTIDFSQDTTKKVESKAQEIFDGLACGFGGGSCLSSPVNWAPLAPGNDPVVFGIPIGDGFRTQEGIPTFSVPTTLPTPFGPIPFIWPGSPLGAGGYFGEVAPYSSAVRWFNTPTLTLGMGSAICLGTYPSLVGNIPPPGLSPLIKGGNCIVMAKPMAICKDDGSSADGDVTLVSGLGTTRDTWNGKSCTIAVHPTDQDKEDEKQFKQDIISYVRNPGKDKTDWQDRVAGINVKISKRNVSSLSNGPLVKVGGQTVGMGSLDISLNGNNKIADITDVVNVKNKRIAAFPDFIMNWLTRQKEELTTSLLTPPNLTVIPPTDFGQNAKVDSSFGGFMDQIQAAYSAENAQALKTQMIDAYNAKDSSSAVSAKLTNGKTILSNGYDNAVQNGINGASSAINAVGGGINSLRAAYTFIGKLPFIKLTKSTVNINVPWILPSELDNYMYQIQGYIRQLEYAEQNWCADLDPACLEQKGKLRSSGLKSALEQNLKRIEEYKRFPEKLQKYVTWKQQYLYQILCNIEAIEKMTFGWVHDNGVRFQKWAELYVLIKAIAESWQPLLDIFSKTSAQCGVCRNERYNSQYWKFKLISMIVPDLPVIRFPKWPDIILDLSDIRLAINISVPDFQFRISPLRLPALPGLSLPNSPNFALTLPNIPVLPALPDLPDLPKLPSLPLVNLPDLPPPPKIPKLGGSIQTALKILNLIAKMYCYYQKTMLVPEWQVGDVIAQRTERQGTLPFDFLDINFPQFKLPSIKEIRISTHINYEIRSDFITEFAKNAVKPLNEFSTDLQKHIPSKIGEDVNVESPIESKSVDLNKKDAYIHVIDSFVASLEAQKDDFLSVDEFTEYFKKELTAAGLIKNRDQLDRELRVAKLESQALQKNLEDFNTKKFNTLKKLIETEERKTGELQNIIDALTEENPLLSKNALTPYLLASDDVSSDNVFEDFNQSQFETIARPVHSDDFGLGQSVDSLSQKTRRIAQNDLYNLGYSVQVDQEKGTAKISGSPLATNYLPEFNGIYILTEPSKTQTRLFDYTEPLSGSDEVETVDIDHDGDTDYLFLLGGILYMKENHTKAPQKTVDTDTHVEQLSRDSAYPTVPNYFGEVLSTPGELQVEFHETIPGEKGYRIEFFDHYVEWDKLAINGFTGEPKETIDLLVDDDLAPDAEGIRSGKVNQSLDSGFDDPSFLLESPKIHVFTGSIYLSLSPNRPLYTGKKQVDITYKTSEGDDPKVLHLEPYSEYQFGQTMEIRAEGGPLFIIEDGLSTEKYTGSKDFDGLPILPSMKIYSEKPFSRQNHIKNRTEKNNADAVYMMQTLGKPAKEYSVAVDYPNGYYYARITSLSDPDQHLSNVVLLSPQSASDKTAPVVAFPGGGNKIRIPVYAAASYKFDDIITELSDYDVRVDADTSVDSDKNGIFDDDFVKSATGVNIASENITFGPYDTPGNKNMLLEVRDEYGNITRLPMTVEIYTPIPSIDSFSGKILSGSLSEPLSQEPIHIWRLRGSEYPTLVNTDPLWTDSVGKFGTGFLENPEQIIVTASGGNWQIGYHGEIHSLPNTYHVRVIPATQGSPMVIRIEDGSNKDGVYEQSLFLSDTNRIVDGSRDDTSGTGVIVTPKSGTSLMNAKYDDPNISGGAYLVDADYNPLLAIAKDGNIYQIHPNVSLSLDNSSGDHIRIIAKQGNETIATFDYTAEFYYTKK